MSEDIDNIIVFYFTCIQIQCILGMESLIYIAWSIACRFLSMVIVCKVQVEML